jgi:uncharacterized membrane protein YsdA (DUF1294 family)
VPYLAAAYLVMSFITLGAFALDKRAAGRQARRTPERTLHTLELLGGWPGAFLAMILVHHKNRKPSFWLVTATIALFHAVLWAAFFWPR